MSRGLQPFQATSNLVTLIDGTNIAWDMSQGNDYTVTLGGTRTMSNFSGGVPGQSGILVVVQDGSGGRTLAWSGYYKFASATAPVLSTGIGAKDILAYFVESATLCHIALSIKGSA